jgi:hypothetical protein
MPSRFRASCPRGRLAISPRGRLATVALVVCLGLAMLGGPVRAFTPAVWLNASPEVEGFPVDGTFLADRFLAADSAVLEATPADHAPESVVEPPAAVFEGFGLEGFTGARSVAAALRRSGATRQNDDIKVGVNVRGPSARGAVNGPMAAEVCSRIQRVDLAAGLRANPARIAEGPACWEGRIGVANERDDGREALELRTTLGHWQRDGSLGVEVGPRIERQIRKGTTFFVDGKAEARALRAQDSGWWALPGTSADASGMLGFTARTGIVR